MGALKVLIRVSAVFSVGKMGAAVFLLTLVSSIMSFGLMKSVGGGIDRHNLSIPDTANKSTSTDVARPEAVPYQDSIIPLRSYVITDDPTLWNEFSSPDGDNSGIVFSPTSTVQVLTPNGGETYYRFNTIPITWSYTNPNQHLLIEYSTDNAATWNLVQNGVLAGLGTISWTIPNIASNFCRIKITVNENPSDFDFSNSIFKIIKNSLGLNLVAHYPFNGNANDVSGSGNNGTVSGPVLYSDRFGKSNLAYRFTAKNQVIDISNITGPTLSSSFWYYFENTGSDWNTVLCRDGDTYHQLIIHPTTKEIGFYNNGWYSSGFVMQVNTWYHIVQIKDNTNLRLYINNQKIQVSNSSFSNSSYPLSRIGNYGGLSQGSLGVLDDFRFYSRMLSEEEILALYNEQRISTVYPGQNSTNISIKPIFKWKMYDPGYTYQFQVSTDQNFTSLLKNVTGIADTSYSYTSGEMQLNSIYYWRVKGFTATDTTQWSYASKFTTSGTIYFTPLPDTTATGSRFLTNVRIENPNGVNYTTFKPRIYFKKHSNTNSFSDNTNGTNGWKWTEAIAKNGSLFTFLIDYTKLFGGVIETSTAIQYFVVAQDTVTTPAVFIYRGTLASQPVSVSLTSSNFPVTGFISSYSISFLQNVNIWNFISVAESGLGRAIRMNVDNGIVVGTYQTSPTVSGDPSRTTVDFDGSVWVGNRAEGSVCRIGLVLGGIRCNSDYSDNPTGDYLKPPFSYPLNALAKYDKNGDGLIKTSMGMKNGQQHFLPWENNSPTDEVIMYINGLNSYCSGLTHVRHVSVDSSNNIWVGGHVSGALGFLKINGQTGQVMATNCNSCGGYGGLVDRNQVVWSSSREPWGLLRYNTQNQTQTCTYTYGAYGLSVDTRGNIWQANWEQSRVRKFRPSGILAGDYSISRNARGVAVTPSDNHIWIANSNDDCVTRMDSVGNIIKVVAVGDHPTGVAVDYNGKIWTTNYYSHSLSRINPNISNGIEDTTIMLPPGAYPYNYSDMTGTTLRSVYPERFRSIPVINGPLTVITHQNSTYTTPQRAGTTIVWSVNGGVINGSTSNDTIVVNWGNCGAGTIKLVQTLIALGIKDSLTLAVAIMLPPPVQHEPVNAATQVNTDPVLSWHSDSLATSYRLQLSTTPGFTTLLRDTTGLTDTTWATPMLTFSQTYYWRVKSFKTGCSSDWSTTRSFTTMPAPVNLPPTINSIPNPAPIIEDASQQTVYFSGITDGNPHPLQVQNLTVTATSSVPGKIPNPIVTYTPNNPTGYLRYTPVANANGVVLITVTVTDDGGTANGGVNTTSTTFQVTITPVNDTPTANAGPDQTITAGQTVTLTGIASTDVDGDILQYRWSAPPGLSLSDSTVVSPLCQIPLTYISQNYTFSLKVYDGQLYSTPDQVTITAVPPPPHIVVTPTQLTDTVFQNQNSSQQIVIQNTGIGNLNFNITENVSWMSVFPVSGNVAPGGFTYISVTLSPGNQAGGSYATPILINSNDPQSPVVSVPVTLVVLTPLSVQATVNPQSVCQGSTVQLNAIATGGYGNYSYTWSSDPPGFTSNIQNPSAVPLSSSTYSVTISDGHSVTNSSVLVTLFAHTAPSPVTNMVPANNTFNLQLPVQFSWSPSINASAYDIYIWKHDQSKPATPTGANLSQINYTLTSNGPFSYGDTCNWQVVAKNPCFQTQSQVQTFSIRGLPELHVSSVSISQPIAGQSATISWTVRNDGNAATLPGAVWLDRVWISPDAEVRIGEPEDILLGQFTNVSYLNPGQSYVQTVQVNMPENLIGNYFLFVITDDVDALFINWPPSGPPQPYNPPPFITGWSHYGSTVQEYVEHDNFFYKEILFVVPPLPDLQVTSIIGPSNVFSGENRMLTWTVKNKGDGNTNTTTWSDQIYLTTDSILNTGTAINLGSFTHVGTLSPDSSYTQTKTVSIPSNIFGSYFFFVVTDISNNVFEYVFEGNNIKKSDPVSVFLTPPADLIVTTVNSPDTISSTDEFTTLWIVKNQGVSATLVPNWQDGIYLTPNSNYDLTGAILIGSKNRNGTLLPDSVYQSQLSAPFSANIAGPHYLYVKTDINNNVYEFTSENNNVQRRSLPVIIINPDLIVNNLVVPSTNTNSQPFNIQWTTKNAGPGKLVGKTWKERIYASKHPDFIQESAVTIGEITHTNVNLLKGQSISSIKTVTLPDSLSGLVFIYIQTDWSNAVYENTNENNNLTRSATPIDVRKPDLVAGNVVSPVVDSLNQPITVSWSVTNTGTGSVQNRSWTDKLMISYDPVYNPVTAIQLKSLTYTSTLLPGASITKEISLTLPDSIPGPYYLFIHTDATNAIFENLSEANNIARNPSIIQILRPDLIVSSIEAPATALSGSYLQMAWVDKNIGEINIQNKIWTDRVYLSPQPTFVLSTAVLLADKVNNATLNAGDSLANQLQITLPDGIQGGYYLFVHTDFANNIPENANEGNNFGKRGIQINPGPCVDLQVTGVIVADTTLAGANLPVQFTIKNSGRKKLQDKQWNDKVYISASPVWNPSNVSFLREFIHNETVDTSAIYITTSTVNIPSGLTNGNYYLYFYTDHDNGIYESTGENNNIFRYGPIVISALPPVDLLVYFVNNPDSSNSGQSVTMEWSVRNGGNSTTIANWYDAFYLSADTILNANGDIFLGKKLHYGQLSPGLTYTSSHQINLPNGITGNYYLLAVADYEKVNNDEDLTNNYRSKRTPTNIPKQIHISLTPPPNLAVTGFAAPTQVFTGQPFNVHWDVANTGPGITIPDTWTDKIYLSTDFSINSGDILLGARSHTGALAVNQTYSENMQITFPANLTGNYILIIKTDFDNNVYESNEANNMMNVFIVVSNPPPADLIVTSVVKPDIVYAGKPATVQWKIKNTGNNPASGTVKDMVYFSSDTTWDIHDVLWGYSQSWVTLNKGDEVARVLTSKVYDLPVGYYFVLIKTDVLNGIYETEENNNYKYSDQRLYADVTELPLDVVTSDTLFDNENLYFRIPVGDSLNNSTLLTTLKADSIFGMNEMYQRYNAMPSRINHDFASSNPYRGNQEIIIPSVSEGSYYTMLYGNNTNGNKQNISVLAEILDFEIISVSPEVAGNQGSVTLLIRGSNFNPGMRFKLIGAVNIISDSILFANRSQIYATFNLQGAPPGLYDVMADNYCANHDTLFQAFEITGGVKPELGLATITPPNVRANRITSFTIEFTNLGNSNLYNPVIVVQSQGGAPIALNLDDLVSNTQQLTIPLNEKNGPPGMLRPGYIGSVVIYTKSTGPLGFTIVIPN